jgi:hypothetical protein
MKGDFKKTASNARPELVYCQMSDGAQRHDFITTPCMIVRNRTISTTTCCCGSAVNGASTHVKHRIDMIRNIASKQMHETLVDVRLKYVY